MRHGFIRDPKDIKCLIMYCLSFMPFTIGETDLLDMVLIDDAFGYFEFSQAFHELIETRHISAVDTVNQKEYLLTPKGHDLIGELHRDLPLTVRTKAEESAKRVILKIRRESSIHAGHRENPDGSYTVQLKISDKAVDHMSIEMLMVSGRQCAMVEERFRKNAETIYSQLILLLSGSDDRI